MKIHCYWLRKISEKWLKIIPRISESIVIIFVEKENSQKWNSLITGEMKTVFGYVNFKDVFETFRWTMSNIAELIYLKTQEKYANADIYLDIISV